MAASATWRRARVPLPSRRRPAGPRRPTFGQRRSPARPRRGSRAGRPARPPPTAEGPGGHSGHGRRRTPSAAGLTDLGRSGLPAGPHGARPVVGTSARLVDPGERLGVLADVRGQRRRQGPLGLDEVPVQRPVDGVVRLARTAAPAPAARRGGTRSGKMSNTCDCGHGGRLAADRLVGGQHVPVVGIDGQIGREEPVEPAVAR